MAPTDPSAPADQALIDHAAAHGLAVSGKQLRVWRERGLLPRNIAHGLGRGRGTATQPAPEAREMVLWLARHAGRGRRPTDLALQAFADGMPVPERTVRTSFRTAVEQVVLRAERDVDLSDVDDPEEQAARIADQVVAEGDLGTLVPARIQRLDAAIARLGLDLAAPELAELDRGAGPERFTAADAATLAVTVARLGGTAAHNEGIGEFFRAVSPAGAANPLASFVEHLDANAEGPAAQDVEGVLPVGDLRLALSALVESAPLPLLREAWERAGMLHGWAEELCAVAEHEVAAGRLGEDATAWARSSLSPVRLLLVQELKTGTRSLSDQARTAAAVLWIRNMLQMVDALVPGAEWAVLGHPGMIIIPECLLDFWAPPMADT